MILEKIIELVSEQLELDGAEITAETAFIADLGADSLDVAELTITLEEEFSLPDTPDEVLAEIVTVGDLARYIAGVKGEE